MPIARFRLKPGVSIDQAAAALRPLVVEAGNIHGAGIGPTAIQEAYVRWVDNVERQLVSLTRDSAVVQALHTSRYWRIRDLHANTPMAGDLVSSELRIQVEGLSQGLEDLEERARRLQAAPGKVAVLDTNVLIEYLRPDQVPWPQILEVDQVRLVVPLRVIEELDAKKYGASTRLAKRARGVLPWLESALDWGGRPGVVRDGVTIEVPIEGEGRLRPADADAEILASCEDFQQLSGRPVVLVTADTSVLIRAQALGLAVVHPPPEYKRIVEDANDPG